MAGFSEAAVPCADVPVSFCRGPKRRDHEARPGVTHQLWPGRSVKQPWRGYRAVMAPDDVEIGPGSQIMQLCRRSVGQKPRITPCPSTNLNAPAAATASTGCRSCPIQTLPIARRVRSRSCVDGSARHRSDWPAAVGMRPTSSPIARKSTTSLILRGRKRPRRPRRVRRQQPPRHRRRQLPHRLRASLRLVMAPPDRAVPAGTRGSSVIAGRWQARTLLQEVHA